MRLYSGLSGDFFRDVKQSHIENKLAEAFFMNLGYKPSVQERNSWNNSLNAISLIMKETALHDHGVVLEYQLPLTSSRLDCLLLGKNRNSQNTGVIIELKQWSEAEQSDCENEVVTWVGGAHREVLHPSFQVGRYLDFLVDTHTAFDGSSSSISPHSCAYLHNYSFVENDPLLDPKFNSIVADHPLFSKDMTIQFCDYLEEHLANGNGGEVLQKFESGKYYASKKLLDHVGNLVKGMSGFILLDEQQVVYDKVLSCARRALSDGKKQVLIINGGPGTGKSVIALNLFADLSLSGFNTHYATGSKAFTETMRKIIGTKGAKQFKYFNSYMHEKENLIDVLIADESHRIRITSNRWNSPASLKSDKPQIDELIDVSKVSVFLIDDKQVVRPFEIGSSDYIKQSAAKKGCILNEYELSIQFRCSGSESFINWVNNTLGIVRTPNALWDNPDNFEFKIFNSPQSLDNAIRQKAAEGFSSRMTAGYCWPWSEPLSDGQLVDDVVIGDYKRPWNAKANVGKLAPGIPVSDLWAYDPNGINQVGCIYTAQGFEFDYVGVIFGLDLRFDFSTGGWVANTTKSYDSVVKKSKDKFIDLVKNTYRVLLTRGMKGCYVYFMDEDTKKFFQSRIG